MNVEILSNLDKYILQFRQIHFAIETNTFCNWDKYFFFQSRQIHLSLEIHFPTCQQRTCIDEWKKEIHIWQLIRNILNSNFIVKKYAILFIGSVNQSSHSLRSAFSRHLFFCWDCTRAIAMVWWRLQLTGEKSCDSLSSRVGQNTKPKEGLRAPIWMNLENFCTSGPNMVVFVFASGPKKCERQSQPRTAF